MKVNILGVQIDNIKKPEVLKTAEKFLSDGGQHYIVTPNPEIVIAAQKDKNFLEILNKAGLSVPDGFGLVLASRYLRQPIPERITGVDLMLDICRIAEQKNCSVFLLGAKDGLAKPDEVATELHKQFPRLKVNGEAVEILNLKPASSTNKFQLSDLLEKINSIRPDILFVALGAGRQEKFIAENLNSMPTIKLAMGVGGAFDFIAGKISRAPRWMRKIGLEWLWRLFMQPWRWKRILTATIKFSWEIIRKGKKYA